MGFQMTPDMVELIRARAQVQTIRATTAELGCSVWTVKDWCRRAGISFQKYGAAHPSAKHPEATIRRIWELREAGLGYRRIAKRLGMSRSSVQGVLDYGHRYTEMMRFDEEAAHAARW